MKNLNFLSLPIILSVHLAVSSPFANAQPGVAISAGNDPSHPSAILDVQSTAQGTLITRMTTGERDNIATSCACTPAEGLMIFNTTSQCLEMFLNGVWATLSCPEPCSPPAQPSTIYGNSSACAYGYEHYSTDNVGAMDYVWSVPADAIVQQGQGTSEVDVSFGPTGGTISVKARNHLCYSEPISMELTMPVSDLQPPAESSHVVGSNSVEWNWLPSVGADGYKVSIYDDFWGSEDIGSATTYTLNGLPCGSYANLYVWPYNVCAYYVQPAYFWVTTDGTPPSPPAEGAHSSDTGQIIWNWDATPGADGYLYNTVFDLGSATDNGPSTTFTQSGLDSGTWYNLYVWSYGSCGTSSEAVYGFSTEP